LLSAGKKRPARLLVLRTGLSEGVLTRLGSDLVDGVGDLTPEVTKQLVELEVAVMGEAGNVITQVRDDTIPKLFGGIAAGGERLRTTRVTRR
jgi:hypothetical protein